MAKNKDMVVANDEYYLSVAVCGCCRFIEWFDRPIVNSVITAQKTGWGYDDDYSAIDCNAPTP